MRSVSWKCRAIFILLIFLVVVIISEATQSYWLPPVMLSGSSIIPASIGASLSGDTYILTPRSNEIGRFRILLNAFSADGEQFIVNQQITSSEVHSYEADIAVDAHGNLHIVWGSGELYSTNTIHYKKLDYLGNKIIDDTIIAYENEPRSMTLVLDGNGDAHVVYEIGYYAPSVIKYVKVDGATGNTIVGPRIVSVGTQRATMPDIASAGHYVHVVWSDNRNARWYLYYVRMDLNGNAGPNVRLTSGSYYAINPTIAADADNVFFIWEDERNDGELFLKKISAVNGNTLIEERPITDMPSGYAPYAPQAVLGVSGGVQLVYGCCHQSVGGFLYTQILYKQFDSDGNIVIDNVAVTPSTQVPVLFPVLALSGLQRYSLRGTPNVAYSRLVGFPFIFETYFTRSYTFTTLNGIPSEVRRGNSYTLTVNTLSGPRKMARVVFGFNTYPGIKLGGGRVLPINADELFFISLLTPWLVGLSGIPLTLDENGYGTAVWTVPSDLPGGLYLFAVVVVYDMLGIDSFSYPVATVIY